MDKTVEKNYENEIIFLEEKWNACRKQMETLHVENDRLINEKKRLEAHVDELKTQIKFYQGKIEAYQYCLNCRH